MQLVQIMHKVIEQTYEYQKKVQKSGENNIKMWLFTKYTNVLCILSEKICKVVRIFIKKKNDEVSLRISNLRIGGWKGDFEGFTENGRM